MGPRAWRSKWARQGIPASNGIAAGALTDRGAEWARLTRWQGSKRQPLQTRANPLGPRRPQTAELAKPWGRL